MSGVHWSVKCSKRGVEQRKSYHEEQCHEALLGCDGGDNVAENMDEEDEDDTY